MNAIPLKDNEPSGLDQIRALRDGTSDWRGIAHLMSFRPIEVEDGFVAFEGNPGREVYNPIGSVHGGYAATLLDSACACAVHSQLTAQQAYTTLDLNVSFHKGMTRRTGLVRAEGSVKSLGKRVAFAQASLTDPEGRLLASATSTLLIFERG